MKRAAGFTLIELLVTLTVAGILVAAAVPSFRLTFENNRLVTQADDLLGSLMYARSEAIELGSVVTVCASTDKLTCNGTNWAAGWIVGYNPADPTGASTPTATVLRIHPSLSGGNTLVSSSGLGTSMAFRSTGMLTGAGGTFSLCDSRGNSYGRSLVVMASGQPRLSAAAGKQIDGSTAMNCSSPP